jgi:hypothetical protein
VVEDNEPENTMKKDVEKSVLPPLGDTPITATEIRNWQRGEEEVPAESPGPIDTNLESDQDAMLPLSPPAPTPEEVAKELGGEIINTQLFNELKKELEIAVFQADIIDLMSHKIKDSKKEIGNSNYLRLMEIANQRLQEIVKNRTEKREGRSRVK